MTSRERLQQQSTDIAEVLAWGDAAEAANVTLQAQLAEKDAEIASLSETLGIVHDDWEAAAAEVERLKAEIARLTALLNPDMFTLFNEMKSAPTLPLPPVLVIYEGSLHASGVSGTAAPDPAFLRQSFAQIKADNPGVTSVILDQESWWTSGRVEPAQVPWYVTLVNVAKEFWPDVGLYGFPERYTGFLTGTAADNVTRLAAWKARQAPEITAAVTMFVPSFYFINPVHNNEAKRDLWIDTYVDWCEAQNDKPIVPFVWPRVHMSVDPTTPWIDAPTWRSTLDKIYERCDGAVIFGRSGGEDPDPRPSLPWWLETEAFLAAI
jgi:hypothetical protein